VLVTVVIEEAPRIADEDRAEVIEVIEGITRVITAETVAITTLPSAITPAIMKMTPSATIHPHLARSVWMPLPRLCGSGLLVVAVMSFSFSAELTGQGYTPPMALSRLVWDSLASHECRLK